MKKNVRCYGRQNTVFLKEKSFIRNFFDGNKSSDTSVIDTGSKNQLQEDSYISNKENIAINILCSPSLFNEESSKDSYLEQSRSSQKANAKAQQSAKRFKRAKQNRYARKKPKQIYFNTKLCKSAQPDWSVFASHKFTVEQHGECQISTSKQHKNETPKILRDMSVGSSIGLRENINKKNVCSKSRHLPKKFKTPNNLKIPTHYNIDSSGELFHQDCKKKKSVHDLKKKCCGKDVIKTTKQLNKFDFCQQSAELSDSFERNENVVTKYHDKKQNPRNIASDLSLNVLSEFETSPPEHIVPHRNSTNTSIINNVEKSKQKNNNVLVDNNLCQKNTPDFDHISNSPDVCQNSKNSFSSKDVKDSQSVHNVLYNHELVKNVSEKFSNISNADDCSINISKDHSKNNSCILLEGNVLSYKKDNTRNEQNSNFNGVQGTTREKRNAKKSSNIANFTPDEQNIFHCSNSVARMGKFTTSTPVIKSNINMVRLESLLCKDRSESIVPTSCMSFLVSQKQEDNCSMHINQVNENSHNLHLNSLASDHIRKSLQFTEGPIMCSSKKSLTLPNKSSINASKRNRSLLNMSACNVPSSAGVEDEVTKAKLLKLCNQSSVAAFASIYDWINFKVKKIGEGTYGEVFMISKGRSSAVLKIIAVSENSDDKFQSLQSVLSEVEISKCLSDLRSNQRNQTKNFIKVNKASVVCGSYPSVLLEAWDKFSAKSCYNERPDGFRDNQLFVILELEYGGKDMSCFVLRNAVEAESILKQVSVSLAIAEEDFLFEHRDLHLGNILVQRNRRKSISYMLRGNQISIDCHGLQVTIIDFTLSRLYKDGFVYYNDLAADVSLFEQSGDFQFEVYKSMKKNLENKWEECSLYSNVLWLKYICLKMMEYNYSRPSTVAHKKGLKFVDSFNSQLTDCDCAVECLTKCGITTYVFERPTIDKHHTKKSILITTNSFQKSKLSICN